MQKRTLKVAVLAVLAIVLVLGISTGAMAATWSDLPDSVTAKYGVTDNQVAAISDGYGSLWKPYQAITRAQFTKMAVAAFGINLANPATASFTDVPKTDFYYQYIEAAKAAGVINGTTATTFSPKADITRQQAIAIVARYVAMKNGYNLATMYSAEEMAHILAHFGDAASISADLKDEVAFAYDMGLTKGNAYGNVEPLAKLMRIQAAAFLIRAQALVPPANYTAAKIELVSADKTENLIGKVHQATFKVTDAAGHPAAGILVDFDTMFANPLYVGNISPEAAVTNNFGEVTVQMLSAEPGTQRISAAVSGLTAIYTTKYWVAMDEVYILDTTRVAENNAGDDHTWSARVTVIGPGPRSTSQFDWYNVIDAAYDPANLMTDDGVWKNIDSYNEEIAELALDESMRSLPGIGMHWSIIPVSPTVASVGNIVKVDGVAITAAKTAHGSSNAAGVSSIVINSTATGTTKVQVMATYPENPYPQMLFDRDTADPQDWVADADWEPQNSQFAIADKVWIPHTIGGSNDAPITPASAVNNTGEVEQYTLELKDVYGNPIPEYTVLWWIQGVGEFKTDDTSWSGIGEQNKDFDKTDAAGKAEVWVKSLIPGQTIIHCKVMDKFGLPYKEWNVVKQWYSIDQVELGYTNIAGQFVSTATNPVNTPHTWTAIVTGAKLVHVLYDINGNALMDDQALLAAKTDLTGKGQIAYMENNILKWKSNTGTPAPGEVVRISKQGGYDYFTSFAHLTLGAAELKKVVNTVPVVWSALAGKNVYFYTNLIPDGEDANLSPESDVAQAVLPRDGNIPLYVGSMTSAATAVTDAMGKATVTINSMNKGVQYTYVVADYMDNPQDGDPLKPTLWAELRSAMATKTWTAVGANTIKIYESGTPNVEGIRWVNPVTTGVNVSNIAVQVYDQYGNALAGYKVTWEIIGQGTTTAGAEPTYHPYAHLANPAQTAAGTGDRNPNVEANPIFGSGAAADQDYAWGHTLNHSINFQLEKAYAANVDLVLDETIGDLDNGTYSGNAAINHFTNIVNIKVYTPTGALMQQYEVTKVWSLEAPVLTTVLLEQADDATYGTGAITTVDGTVTYRVTLRDQFGNLYTANPANDKLFLNSNIDANDVIVAAADPASSVISMARTLVNGTYTVTYWVDGNNNNQIDAGELVSNAVTTVVVIPAG